jgi:hypothetical protein
MRALVVAPLLFAACLENSPGRPDLPTPTTPIVFAELDMNGVTTIATGGVQTVSIADPLAIGLSGEATTAYEVVPYGGLWPNAQLGEYTVRALAASSGAFSIATEKGVAAGPVSSADLDRVVVQPSAYQLDGHSPFAIDVSRPMVEVALYDADANPLVDGSLAITGAGTTQTAWNVATLPAAAGTYTVTVAADSAPTETATITVSATYEHVVQTLEAGRTCYHAYAGALEVATVMAEVVEPDPAATNCELPR